MKANKRGLLFFLLTLAIANSLPAENQVTTSVFWQTKKSQHFIIYYQDAPNDYVDNLISKAEDYYNDIVEELGYRRFDFWTWENRVKIYLFSSSSDYLQDTGRQGWSGAMVHVKKHTIKTFINQEDFFEAILPHEMTHIIFREFVGIKAVLPLWLDEGVACSQEKARINERLQFAKNLVKSNIYISLDKLSALRDYTLVLPKVFYAQSASLVAYLLEEYGREKFLDFSRKLKDNEPWRKALEDAYHFVGLTDMEKNWKAFIEHEVKTLR